MPSVASGALVWRWPITTEENPGAVTSDAPLFQPPWLHFPGILAFWGFTFEARGPA